MPGVDAQILDLLIEIKEQQARQSAVCMEQCSKLTELWALLFGEQGDNGIAGRLGRLEYTVGIHHCQEEQDDLPTRVTVLESKMSRTQAAYTAAGSLVSAILLAIMAWLSGVFKGP